MILEIGKKYKHKRTNDLVTIVEMNKDLVQVSYDKVSYLKNTYYDHDFVDLFEEMKNADL